MTSVAILNQQGMELLRQQVFYRYAAFSTKILFLSFPHSDIPGAL